MAAGDYDLLIVGGGPVGLGLVCALAGQGLRIGLVEAWPQAADERCFAIAYGSRRMLDTLAVWDGLLATPIRTIHVSERRRPGMARIDCRDYGVPALGYTVLARDLIGALQRRADAVAGVDRLCPATVEDLDLHPDTVRLAVRHDGAVRMLATRLLVAADGGRSGIRERLAIPTLHRDYAQAAVVANLTMERPHRNVAYERFTDGGPLALLPLADNRCALVYTVAREALEQTLALSDAAFAERLEDRFGERLGRVLAASPRAGFSLQLIKARQQGRPRAILLGNAAHTLHPIAGQGLNLGLRDVAVLAELIADFHQSGLDIGSPEILERYTDWRRWDQRRALAFTDGLARLFINPLPPLALARNLGLGLLDQLSPAKRLLAQQSMGLYGRLPRLLRGLPLSGAAA